MIVVVAAVGSLGKPTPLADTRSLNYVDVTRRAQLLGVQIATTAFALILLSFILLTRYLIVKSPGWHDYIITVSLVRTRQFYHACYFTGCYQALGILRTILVLSCIPHGAAMHLNEIMYSMHLV